jgi:death-on-curing family protein
MSEVVYPTRKILEFWIDLLSRENHILKISLQQTDTYWFDSMMNVIARVESSYSQPQLHIRGAELFYNTNKAHNFLDGNKRSSILIVYLFYIINGYRITSNLNIRTLAKELAKSHGRSRHEYWINKIRKCFENNTEQM